MAHFTVTGEFITQQARSFWADEDEPDRALGLMRMLIGISDSQIMDVLEGRAKLTGDSTVGVGIEPDNVKLPTLADVVSQLKRERDEAKDLAADLLQLTNGDVEMVSSPTGRRIVPLRKTSRNSRSCAVLKDGYEWADCENRNPEDKEPPVWRQFDEERYSRKFDSTALAQPPEPLPSPPEPPRIPPKPDDKITSNTGWLSPDGKFYGCNYSGHNTLMWHLNESPGGWIKVSYSDSKQWFFCDDYANVSPAAKAMISVYCAEKAIKAPWWITGKDED